MSTLRVLLVDDHALIRAGYRALLEGAAEFEIVAEAGTAELACRHYVDHAPDVVVMDLALPGMSGLEGIRRIVARDPGARVLVISMHEDPVFVEQALRAGAQGYITKSSAADVLAEAVRQVAAGGAYLDRQLAQHVALQGVRGERGPFDRLSTREFEIFSLIAQGLSTKEIAQRVSLSAKTVSNYNTQIKAKLGVETSAEIVRLAIRHGIVQP